MSQQDDEERRARWREYQRKWTAEHRDEIYARRRARYAERIEEERAKARANYDPERNRAYYLANRERILERNRAYGQANAEIKRERSRAWYLANRVRKAELDRAWRESHKDVLDTRRRANVRALKLEVWQHYGGPQCSCCGAIEYEFLTIDHINGGGGRHRKALRLAGSANVYRWLKKQAYPDGYRVLCMNCNFARGLYGHCPHERTRSS